MFKKVAWPYRQLSLMAILLLLVFTQSVPVYAQYGTGDYSECTYGTPLSDCDEVVQPPSEEPETEPDSVQADVDDDSEYELAIDQDGNPDNGFEVYDDPSDNTTVVVRIDGDNDDKFDYFIDTDDDGIPNVYWDPDDGILVQIVPEDYNDDGTDDWPFDSDGDGEDDSYYDPVEEVIVRIVPPVVTIDVDGDGGSEEAIDTNMDDSDGFEDYNDPDGSSGNEIKLDGDFDGKTDFLIDTNDDGIPDVYFDPDDYFTSPVTVDDIDNDGTDEYIFDNDNDGTPDVYYDPDDGKVYPLPEATVLPRELPGSLDNGLYQQLYSLLNDIPMFLRQLLFLLPLWLLSIAAILLWYLAKRETNHIQTLRHFLEEEQKLADEKNTFLQLASHYIRTPLTIVSGYLELAESTSGSDISSGRIPLLKNEVEAVKSNAEHILSTLDDRIAAQAVGRVQSNEVVQPTKHSYLQVILYAVVSSFFVFLQFALADFQLVPFATWLVATTILASIILFVLVFVLYRRSNLVKREVAAQTALLQETESLDDAKYAFIGDVVNGLSSSVASLAASMSKLDASDSVSKMRQGLSDLKKLVSLFSIISLLRLSAVREQHAEAFNTYDICSETLERYLQAMQVKGLSRTIDQKQHSTVFHNRKLYLQAIDSVLNNAIAYAERGSSIAIEGEKRHSEALVHIHNKGPILSEDEIAGLFKPFTRAEGTTDFTHQGMGLSLYTDMLIMHYIGGEIDIKSEGDGMTVSLSVPVNSS